MGPIATALKHLLAAGVTGDALVKAVADMESAMPSAKDESAERRRAKDRERKRASRVSGGPPVHASEESADSADVRGIPQNSAEAPNNSGIYLTPVEFDYGLSGASARDERERVFKALMDRSKELFDASLPIIRDVANMTRLVMAPMLPLIRLMAPMTGEPCSWAMDIVPALKTGADQKRKDGGLIINFDYFVAIALRNRDQRLKGNPEVSNVPARTGGNESRANGTRPQRERATRGLGASVALMRDIARDRSPVQEGPEGGLRELVVLDHGSPHAA